MIDGDKIPAEQVSVPILYHLERMLEERDKRHGDAIKSQEKAVELAKDEAKQAVET